MMTTNGQKSLSAIGFLTVTRDAEHGLFGGYLVLNTVGRPLEFHCTAPVRPNRAQEILYGPTLEPYLYGERIGPTLLKKSKSRPLAVFTDVLPAMTARQFVPTPLLLVVPGDSVGRVAPATSSSADERTWRLDAPHTPAAEMGDQLSHFRLGSYRLAVDREYPDDETVVTHCWREFDQLVDLDEPFSRIREAIDEARRGV